MEHIELSLEQVKKAARDAYDAGTLLMQAPADKVYPAQYRSMIDGKEYRCALGAAFPPEFCAYLEKEDNPEVISEPSKLNRAAFPMLVSFCAITLKGDEADLIEIDKIQVAHDGLLDAPEMVRKHKLNTFLRLIGHPAGDLKIEIAPA